MSATTVTHNSHDYRRRADLPLPRLDHCRRPKLVVFQQKRQLDLSVDRHVSRHILDRILLATMILVVTRDHPIQEHASVGFHRRVDEAIEHDGSVGTAAFVLEGAAEGATSCAAGSFEELVFVSFFFFCFLSIDLSIKVSRERPADPPTELPRRVGRGRGVLATAAIPFVGAAAAALEAFEAVVRIGHCCVSKWHCCGERTCFSIVIETSSSSVVVVTRHRKTKRGGRF
jgi:hypothetical protein